MASSLIPESVTLAVFVVFAVVASVALGAPLQKPESQQRSEADKADCDQEHSQVYDQRQNGTENYRIHLNGVVVLVAPAETVLQAAQLASLQGDLDSLLGGSSSDVNQESSGLKPKPRPPSPASAGTKPEGNDSPNTYHQQLAYQKDLAENVRHEVEGLSHASPLAGQKAVGQPLVK